MMNHPNLSLGKTATIIGSASTQSRGKRPGRLVTLTHCSGVHEYSTDGRKILSWPMAQYGPLLGYPHFDNDLTIDLIGEMYKYMNGGRASLGSYAPELEQQLADKLATLYAPYLRSPDIGIRFFSNGSDATQCAVALSRYATGREAFVSVGYHGGSSPVFNSAPQNGGVLRANTEGRFDSTFAEMMEFDNYTPSGESAAWIVEVPAVEDEKMAAIYLRDASDYCQLDDSYFILDDIVTSFRFHEAGALGYYSNLLPAGSRGIQADFICLGKALSTYGKVSALLGPRDIMEALADKVFASYTFNDHPLGFADALWTLGEYERHGKAMYSEWMGNTPISYDKEIGTLPFVGMVLKRGLNSLFEKYGFPAKCIGHPARSAIVPEYSLYAEDDAEADKRQREAKLRTLLSRVVDEHDILLHMPQFVTSSHTLSHVEQTLSAVEIVLKDM